MTEQIPDVYSFEGDEVTAFTAQIPSTKLEVDEQWPRGTVINLNTTFRVRSVRIEEDRNGNLTRHHVLALEEAQVTSTLTPAQRKAQHDAAVAAEEASQDKVIEEEPGHEDVEPAQADDPVQAPDPLVNDELATEPEPASAEPEQVHNDLSPGDDPVDVEAAGEDPEWSDVDARDQAKREGLQVESVEQTKHVDDDEFESVNF